MGREIEERLVKPPEMEGVTSGRLFGPSPSFRKKYVFIAIVTILTIWVMIAGTLYLTAWITSLTGLGDPWGFFESTFVSLTHWYLLIVPFILIPGLLIANRYINSIQYSVRTASGEAMPEVYVHRGILDVTEHTIPLRTITHVTSRAGPFDRLFGIGNVFIETAGGASVQMGAFIGPDIKLEGLIFYNELRDFLIREMRLLRGAYVTGTEVSERDEFFGDRTQISTGDGQQILIEILRVLKRIEEKLDSLG